MSDVTPRRSSNSEIGKVIDPMIQEQENERQDGALDDALDETFPASDPISISRPPRKQSGFEDTLGRAFE